MRVQLVDPSAFTPPYDRALAAALARGGAEVELVTTEFLYGPVPEAEGYEVDERFYQRTASRGLSSSARLPFKWLTRRGRDRRILPPTRPRVMTAHYTLEPNASRRAARAAGKVFGTMDAVVAHSEHTAARLRDEVGLPAERVRVIPHGAFDYLTRLPEEKPLPEELQGAAGPVVLSFGLLRPYKGLENLLEAFRQVPGAELWIVGNPRMDVEPLRELAAGAAGRVRFVTRF